MNKMKTNYQIMRKIIRENVKYPKCAEDQILEALEIKDKNVLRLIDEFEYLEDRGITFWAEKNHKEFSKNIIDFKEKIKQKIKGS